MKHLFLLAGFAVTVTSCAQQAAPPAATTGRPYSVYATGADIPGPNSAAYRKWSTARLQQRRIELYNMIPQTPNRQGIPQYTSRGGQLPQQDEIRDIEGELNRRYRAGDPSALLQPAWPDSRRHGI